MGLATYAFQPLGQAFRPACARKNNRHAREVTRRAHSKPPRVRAAPHGTDRQALPRRSIFQTRKPSISSLTRDAEPNRPPKFVRRNMIQHQRTPSQTPIDRLLLF